ncbi:MAG: hypothetical protein HY552_05090 [Elusimicrobia bacterium]|nr:hypothetical protein [Elusimicrobiota bacterium]
MAIGTLRRKIRVRPRLLRAGAVTAMLLAAGAELGSENITLTTYYPAPSGIYTRMITTGDTYLARDGGAVGIKTSAPAAGYALDVNGKIHAATDVCTDASGGKCLSAMPSPVRVLSGHGVSPGAPANCSGTFQGGLCSGLWFQDIVFSQPFTSTPHVLVTPENISNQGGCVGGATDKVVAYPANMTRTGFRLYVGGSPDAGSCGAWNGWSSMGSAGWIAVGS